MEQSDGAQILYAKSDTPDEWPVAVGIIGLKLVGVFFIAQSLTVLPYVGETYWRTRSSFEPNLEWVRLVIALLWPMVVGVLLVTFARSLALRLFSRAGQLPGRMDPSDVVAMISVGLGVWLISSSIVGLATGVIEIIADLRASPPGMIGTGAFWISHSWTLSRAVQVAIGVFMFIRPGWIVGKFLSHTRMPHSVPSPGTPGEG